MNRLRDISIRKKISLVNLAIAGLTVMAACTMLFFVQLYGLKRDMASNLLTIAEVVANNCSAAMAFNDTSSAEEALVALRAKSTVVEAFLRRPDNTIFAQYKMKDRQHFGVAPHSHSLEPISFDKGFCLIQQPVELEGKTLGYLHMTANFQHQTRALIRVYAMVLLGVSLCSIMVAFLLSSLFQRILSRPILQLAEVAKTIADKKDFSMRVTKQSNDELGSLTEAFNLMLIKIGQNDEVMRRINQEMEKEIGERKAAQESLRASDERFQLAVQGSSDGIWDWDVRTNKVYYSPRWKRMIGYEDSEFEDSHDAWESRLHPEEREMVVGKLNAYLSGELTTYEVEHRLRHKDGHYVWILCRGAALRDAHAQPFRMAGSHTDITQRKEAEQKMEQLNKQLVDTSRQAGMAEVATGVLHNVGNVLNSINVSATIVTDGIRKSRIALLKKMSALFQEHTQDIGEFLTQDPKGKQVPQFIENLAVHLEEERTSHLGELEGLRKNLDHVKDIISMQQSYARVAGVVETLDLEDLVEDAISLNTAALARHKVHLVRDFARVPRVQVDKHKVLQILINLIRNAKYALDAGRPDKKQITLRIHRQGSGPIQISVRDNGIGIEPENLSKIFRHGFTTKKEGHGFGLHSGALAAKEMGGNLTVESAGIHQGASFVLELPLSHKQEAEGGAAAAKSSTNSTETPGGHAHEQAA